MAYLFVIRQLDAEDPPSKVYRSRKLFSSFNDHRHVVVLLNGKVSTSLILDSQIIAMPSTFFLFSQSNYSNMPLIVQIVTLLRTSPSS